MTYRCAVFGLEHLGIATRPDPTITCDGCGLVLLARGRHGGPPAWLLKNKAPKGWTLERTDDPFTRRDWCPRCAPEKRSEGNG